MTETPTAIPTTYRGVELKSRLEARAAVLFDKLGWTDWRYEPFSLMLPSGIPYIPDFWIESAWLMVECRGYETERSVRQLDDFIEMLETTEMVIPELDGPSNVGSHYNFLLIGPETVRFYGYHETKHPTIPASKRKLPWEFNMGILAKCSCGWRVSSADGWCPNCDSSATAAAIIQVKKGLIYLNGIAVEDLGRV